MIYYTIYTSTPRDEMTEEILDSITEVSMQHNIEKGITGMLLGIENKYLQYLEGDEAEVSALFRRIKQDPRHQDVTQWISGMTDKRIFTYWSMGSWMLPNEDLENLEALGDLNRFLKDPYHDDFQSRKFLVMMENLLKIWIAHEAERVKKLSE